MDKTMNKAIKTMLQIGLMAFLSISNANDEFDENKILLYLEFMSKNKTIQDKTKILIAKTNTLNEQIQVIENKFNEIALKSQALNQYYTSKEAHNINQIIDKINEVANKINILDLKTMDLMSKVTDIGGYGLIDIKNIKDKTDKEMQDFFYQVTNELTNAQQEWEKMLYERETLYKEREKLVSKWAAHIKEVENRKKIE